ncbi:class I SAM-dependent methyltransferase [Streptomyces sp. NPDC097619]|uniref:class I SAM-dependent methyltransferase n=1 Tax=Streptomyces sp. NPDC097619 TaxID=3157228 RepID=UPI0033247C86
MSVRADAHGGIAALRAELLDGLSGRVVEIGAGNGLNFPHYPGTVTDVLAVEPEPVLRRLAERAADHVTAPVRVVSGTAEALPAADASFDAAVCCLVLCTVGDLPRSLAELHRVVRPGGEVRFFEHGLAPGPGTAAVQRALDRTVWPRLFGGCHTARDVLAALEAAGFEITAQRGVRVPERGPALPTSSCVLGAARRPPG